MPISRRNILLAAGGFAFVTTGAGALRVTRAPRTAAAPWALDPTPPADPRLDAFRHAVLAPNPHNRQPWTIRLVGAREAIISCDLDRRLPETDPFDRQIVIGFGCFTEIAAIAAAERGFRLEVTPFPNGEPRPRLDTRPVAHLRFTPDAAVARDPLFAAIRKRHTTREPYDLGKTLDKPAAHALGEVAGDGVSTQVLTAQDQVAALRELVIDAFRVETMTPRTLKESIDLLRIGAAEIDANPDGIALAGPMFEALSLFGDLARRQAQDPNSSASRSTLDKFNRAFAATPAFLATISANETRAAEFATGRAWLRAALVATTHGLAMQPVSQSLQEYPEMKEAFARVHRLVAAPAGGRVQMLARLGYGPAVAPAPRWPLETRLTRA